MENKLYHMYTRTNECRCMCTNLTTHDFKDVKIRKRLVLEVEKCVGIINSIVRFITRSTEKKFHGKQYHYELLHFYYI